MGTLFNQPARELKRVTDEDLFNELVALNQLRIKTFTGSMQEIIATKHMLELQRRNELFVTNADILDEQLAGIGDLLVRLITLLEEREDET